MEQKVGLKPEGALPYMMKNILDRLRRYELLSQAEAKEVLMGITSGLVNESQMTAFIAVYMMRRTTIEELSGFRQALMEQCIPIKLEAAAAAIDIAGTGGDGKNTFNISTLTAAVVAGAGYKVVKHGNYSATSVTGSSNVLEQMGYRFHTDEANLNRQLDQSNLCFLHAPFFHPAMKRVAQIRKNLAVRTFFNLLGPLSNPARPGHVLLGANALAIARLYHYFLQDVDTVYRVVHSLDGYDEVSLTGSLKLYGPHEDRILNPGHFGLSRTNPDLLGGGGSTEAAAAIFLAVLENRGTLAQEEVVLANSALAIQCLRPEIALIDCVEEARVSLQSGNAYTSFKNAVQISRQ